MSSANLLSYLNVLNNNVFTMSAQIKKIEATLENKSDPITTVATSTIVSNSFDNSANEKKFDTINQNISEIKKNIDDSGNIIAKVDQLINKSIKDRLEVNNTFINRQIKALQDQIDFMQKSIDNKDAYIKSRQPTVEISIDSEEKIAVPEENVNISPVENVTNLTSDKKKRHYTKKSESSTEKNKHLNIE
jgi:hypothetical protein